MGNQHGTLYGIGVGPGDPELITVKGLNLLQKAPVVAFPMSIKGPIGVAEQIVAQWLTPTQVKLPLHFAFVQDQQTLSTAWELAATQVWQYLVKGQDVAFVCEGDVSFYSTFTYLAQTLQKIEPEAIVQVIPGICSPLAASAVLGIPLTIKDQRLAILPALYHLDELAQALNWADVIVLMKVSSVYEEVWQVLKDRNLLDRAYIIQQATLPNQVIYRDLSNYPRLKLPYFSLMIVQANV